MKLCKDCKHYDGVSSLSARGKRQVGIDPVSGDPVHRYKVLEYAFLQRSSIMPWRCGRIGRYFEARGAK